MYKDLLSTQLIEIFNEVLLAKDSEQLRNNILRAILYAVYSRRLSCLRIRTCKLAVIQRIS